MFRIVRRGADLFNWQIRIDDASAQLFLREMAQGGGAPVFPGEPESLSATSYICDALASETTEGKWWDGLPLEKVRRFMKACYRPEGGFGFAPGADFFANASCTRFGLRVREYLRQIEPDADFMGEAEQGATANFLRGLFDPEAGGFRGYPRPGDIGGSKLQAAQTPTDKPTHESVHRETTVVDEPSTDLEWFYSQLESLQKLGVAYVAIDRERLVGQGSAQEAMSQARASGARAPLLVRVPTARRRQRYTVGM